jgi:RHS repeat-associated protein
MNLLKTIILAIAAAFFATPNLQAKYLDDETDLIYYGYRYYNPSTGRWLSRDPMEEDSSVNLYGYIDNEPIDGYDFLGLFDLYTHTDGSGGHAGITDDQGVNYDYGRYYGTYSGKGGLHAGPNILIISTGWPPQGKEHSWQDFHFAVCPDLDKAIREALVKEVAKGKNPWPDDVLKKFKSPPKALSPDALYMGTDWSVFGPNCATFTTSVVSDAASRVLKDPKTTKLAKDEAGVLQDLYLNQQSGPAELQDRLNFLAGLFPKFVIKVDKPTSNSNNDKKSADNSSCGCSN